MSVGTRPAPFIFFILPQVTAVVTTAVVASIAVSAVIAADAAAAAIDTLHCGPCQVQRSQRGGRSCSISRCPRRNPGVYGGGAEGNAELLPPYAWDLMRKMVILIFSYRKKRPNRH